MPKKDKLRQNESEINSLRGLLTMNNFSVDAYTPKEIAARIEMAGIS